MKIKVALIPNKYTIKAQVLSSRLQNAMEAGEMSVADSLTEELFSLMDSKYSLSISEEYWLQVIKKIRSFNDDFKSNYIIAKPKLEMIIASNLAESFADVSNIVKQALKYDGVILQLPFEEENTDV